uniref:Uncharacterized protein n=1 Tax=Magallana gigas TaxID=29159 RepID=A0A8W8NYW8_MAGGI
MEKPKKEMDRALITKAIRGSFKERRLFITKNHDGNLKDLLRKLPVLGKAEYKPPAPDKTKYIKSTSSSFQIPPTTKVAQKPCQRRRPKAERTRHR